MSPDKTERIIEGYLFLEKEPIRDEILELIQGEKLTILERKKLCDRILAEIIRLVDTFITGVTG